MNICIYFIIILISNVIVSNANSKWISGENNDELSKLLNKFLTFLRLDNSEVKNIKLSEKSKLKNNVVDQYMKNMDHYSVKNSMIPSCGRVDDKTILDKRIYGGRTATPHSWPWQIRLQKQIGIAKFKDLCGGTIISPHHVVTAAHCLWDVTKDEVDKHSTFLIVAGDHDKSTDTDGVTQTVHVKTIFSHPHYSSQPSRNDIAVLKLKSPFNFNENISSCCIPQENPSEERFCYATGWGDTEKGYSDLLKEVKVPLISTKECIDKFHGPLVDDNMLCAGYEEGTKDTCQGDSGGPLVCFENKFWVLDGVTSWGIGCALPNKPGVYTKVFPYVGWIKKVTGIP